MRISDWSSDVCSSDLLTSEAAMPTLRVSAMFAWHATSAANIDAITRDGLRGPSYWSTDEDVLAYYIETVQDEGDSACIIEVDLSSIDEAWLEPDLPGIEEPVKCSLSDEEIWEDWQRSDQTWQDSVEIVGSVRCRETLAPGMLRLLPETEIGRAHV